MPGAHLWSVAVKAMAAIVLCVTGTVAVLASTGAAGVVAARTPPDFQTLVSANGELRLVGPMIDGSLDTTAKPEPPRVLRQPAQLAVHAGARAHFSAAVLGSPHPKVGWQVERHHGGSWRSIAGAHSDTFAFFATRAENGWRYRAVFSNSAGQKATRPAALTVTDAGPATTTTVPATSTTLAAPAPLEVAPAPPDTAAPPGPTSTSTTTQPTAATSTSSAAESTTSSGPGESPTVTEQPAATSTVAGAQASFVAAASGDPTPVVQWQVSTHNGSSWANISGANSPTYTFTVQATQNGDEFAAVFSNTGGEVSTNGATLTVAEPSSNWSGQVDSGQTFSAVSGSWTVPSVSCTQAPSSASVWVGIDGYGSGNSVEQDGTEQDCNGGSPDYYAWYEMYGDSSVSDGYEVALSTNTYPVSPGDGITASVSFVGDSWTLSITDTSRSWNFSIQVAEPSPPPSQSSAEWIVERPNQCPTSCSLESLANFGAVSFTAATASVGGTPGAASQWDDQVIDMTEGSTVLAAAYPLDVSGEEFTDRFESSG